MTIFNGCALGMGQIGRVTALLLLTGCAKLSFMGSGTPYLSFEEELAARQTDVTGLNAIGEAEAARRAGSGQVYVTYGQSNATNAGSLGYRVRGPVFMVFRGQAYPYADPALGGTGPGGTVWGRLGDRLVDQGASSVFFATAGYGGATMAQLASPPHLSYFMTELRATKAALGRIDGVLIHQGESNHYALRGKRGYRADFEALLAQIRMVTDAPVYLAQATICGNESDTRLLAIQDDIIRETPNVLRGPNTDLLVEPALRKEDGCHFSADGLDAFAAAWDAALRAASED